MPAVNPMEESKHKGKIGPELIVAILSEQENPITTKHLQEEVKKVESMCLASSVIALNVMRIAGTIKGKRTEDRKFVWWVDK
jgi:hypothetical protein